MLTCESFQYTNMTPFININITQLCKPTTSQFDDRLIIGYGKVVTGLKIFGFHNPNNSGS